MNYHPFLELYFGFLCLFHSFPLSLSLSLSLSLVPMFETWGAGVLPHCTRLDVGGLLGRWTVPPTFCPCILKLSGLQAKKNYISKRNGKVKKSRVNRRRNGNGEGGRMGGKDREGNRP